MQTRTVLKPEHGEGEALPDEMGDALCVDDVEDGQDFAATTISVNSKSIQWLVDCIHKPSMSSISSWDQIHISSNITNIRNINPIHKMSVNYSR